MRLDFMCPGMLKCGTTTLNDILKQHPNICVPYIIKEPRWLNDYDLCMNRDVNWYAERYYGISGEHPQKDDILYGEITPSFGVTSAKRLHDLFGGCKIIFLLRNPVERLWSHFNMNFKQYSVMISKTDENRLRACSSQSQAFSLFCDMNFEKIGNSIKYIGSYTHVLSQQGYAFNCKTYLKFFGRENIKIILFEDFVRNPEEVCKELFLFLGVKENVVIDYSIKSNIGSYNAITEEERRMLVDLERKRKAILRSGSPKEIKAVLKERSLLNHQIKDKAQNREKEYPSQKCIEMLQKYFSDDKKYVEEYLQRDLSNIWF